MCISLTIMRFRITYVAAIVCQENTLNLIERLLFSVIAAVPWILALLCGSRLSLTHF